MRFPRAAIKAIILFTAFVAGSISAQAQNTNTEYQIDASERKGQVYPVTERRAITSTNFDERTTAVLVNRQLYNGGIITHLLPFLSNEKQVKSITVIRDETSLRKYTADKTVTRLLKVKLSRKMARRIRQEHSAFRQQAVAGTKP